MSAGSANEMITYSPITIAFLFSTIDEYYEICRNYIIDNLIMREIDDVVLMRIVNNYHNYSRYIIKLHSSPQSDLSEDNI